jgi:DNA recombination protein RmuC
MIESQTLLIVILVILGVIGVAIYFFSKQVNSLKNELKKGEDDVLVEWLKDMKTSVEKNSDVLERQLGEQRKSFNEQMQGQREAMSKQTKLIWERLDKSSEVIQGVQKQLGGIQEFGNDMKDLSNVLKSPKLRGGLGEQLLYEILAVSLPKDMYKTQYKFKGGNLCDAVILTERGIIPIDSKFPMEKFKLMLTQETQAERDSTKKGFVRDVKNRIDEIASKYILPEEGTVDFAVMYIPSENVFYELITNTPDVADYARQKNVFMTSPNTFSYQVKSILLAYQQQELQKHAGEILKSLAGIKVEAEKFNDELSVLDGHIDRTSKSMGNVRNKYARLFGKIESTERLDEVEKKPLLQE